MTRDIVSWGVLILIVVVSFVLMTAPYVWVQRRYSKSAASSSPGVHTPSLVRWRHLLAAFFVGFVGNVVWWWVVFELPDGELSYYLGEMNINGVFTSTMLFWIFSGLSPFIWTKLRHHSFTRKRIIIASFLSLLVLICLSALGILLFVIGWGYAVSTL